MKAEKVLYHLDPAMHPYYENGRVSKLDENGGYDLRAFVDNTVTIEPMKRMLIGTGIYMSPETKLMHSDIRPTSGLPFKFGILATLGLIDWGYRGELKVCLFNLGEEAYHVYPGSKIAQLVFWKEVATELEKVGARIHLPDSNRGELGFGGQSGVN